MKHEKNILPRILALLAVVLLVGLIILSVVVGFNKSVFAESVQSDDSEMVTEESQTVYYLPKGTTFTVKSSYMPDSGIFYSFGCKTLVHNINGFCYFFYYRKSTFYFFGFTDLPFNCNISGGTGSFYVTLQEDVYFTESSTLYDFYVSCCQLTPEVLTVGNTPATENSKVIYYMPNCVFQWSVSAAERLYNAGVPFGSFAHDNHKSSCPFGFYFDNSDEILNSYIYCAKSTADIYFDFEKGKFIKIPSTLMSDGDTVNFTKECYFDNVNLYNFYRDCGASPMVMYVDGRNAASKDYADGYGAGYFSGYESGYNAGRNKGQSDQIVSSPLSLFLQPVSDFMNLKLFGTISLSTVFNIVLFVAIAAIFIKMFGGS